MESCSSYAVNPVLLIFRGVTRTVRFFLIVTFNDNYNAPYRTGTVMVTNFVGRITSLDNSQDNSSVCVVIGEVHVSRSVSTRISSAWSMCTGMLPRIHATSPCLEILAIGDAYHGCPSYNTSASGSLVRQSNDGNTLLPAVWAVKTFSGYGFSSTKFEHWLFATCRPDYW